jgi:hypothetical protein
MENLRVQIKMIKRHMEMRNIHSSLMYMCADGLRVAMLLSGMMVAGCATVTDSRSPKIDQEFGKSVQAGKDNQRIQVDQNKSQSAGSPTSREERVYVDNYIRGSLTVGTALDAPITSSGGSR